MPQVCIDGFHSWFVSLTGNSIGHVAQLASDLLINTLRLERVGYLRHPAVLPFVGLDVDSPSGGLHASLEGESLFGVCCSEPVCSIAVFYSASLSIVVVQQRAPVVSVMPRVTRMSIYVHIYIYIYILYCVCVFVRVYIYILYIYVCVCL